MFIRQGITPGDKLARDSIFSRQNGLPGPLLILQEDMAGHPTHGCKQDLSAPSLFLLPELQTGSAGSTSAFFKPDVPIEPHVAQHAVQLSHRPIRRIPLNSLAY